MDNIKQYFLPGDLVTIRQDIPNKPTMLVVKKLERTVKTNEINGTFFLRILCR